MRVTVIVGVFLMLIMAGCTGAPGAQGEDSVSVTVVDVIDGDTLDVRFPDGSIDRVRLLGVDTPETYARNDPAEFEGVPNTTAGRECLRAAGLEASREMKQLNGSSVTLEFDSSADRRGGYDRLLAYVIEDGTNRNYWLIEQGYARVYVTEFDQLDRFEAAEEAAQDADRGLWNCTDVAS
ncbi:MAG: thermonuclease family protein [Halodesulfurarchaeum sp.]